MGRDGRIKYTNTCFRATRGFNNKKAAKKNKTVYFKGK